LAQLKDLKPLPKKHWSWSLPDFAVTQPDERVYEVARIMGSACLRAEYATPQHVATCVKLCHPAGASIGVNASPYHSTVPDSASPLFAYPDELDLLHKALVNVRMSLHDANFAQNTDVKVGAILLDSERFYRRDDDLVWNAAITERYNVVYDLCKSIFPGVRVIWYEWGVEAAPSKTGWQLAPWYVPEAKTDALSCDLYSPCELHRMRETFAKTVDESNRRGIAHGSFGTVVPYLSLGCGYQRAQKEFQVWNNDWRYGKEYAYQLGQEINVPWFSWPEQVPRFAPWHRADAVVFYPPPFDPRVPEWVSYFAAYCYGAEEKKVLP
jgi:hypothetical protein